MGGLHMPIRTAIWKVSGQPEPLAESSLENEQLLEDMIVAAPCLLSDEWMLIGRQVDTALGGRVDLVAIAPDGSLVLIELKRDRARPAIAQALDYAPWVEELQAEDIAAIYDRFAPGRSLAEDFRQRFGEDLDEGTLNQSHRIIIVAASLDDTTERIVGYLTDHGIPINVLCFQVFTHGDEQLLSRTWLIRSSSDSGRTPLPARGGPKESLERRVLLQLRSRGDSLVGRCGSVRLHLRRRRLLLHRDAATAQGRGPRVGQRHRATASSAWPA